MGIEIEYERSKCKQKILLICSVFFFAIVRKTHSDSNAPKGRKRERDRQIDRGRQTGR